MIKWIRWFFISIVLVVLTACGGSGGGKSQTVKATYKIQDNVEQYSKSDKLKRVDNTTTFIAPTSIGLSKGDVFIYEKIAYKISMVAVDNSTNNITIFTQKPTLDEAIKDVQIHGTIPFSVPEIKTVNHFKLNAKVTHRKTKKKSSVTFECRVPNKAKAVTNGFEFGVVCSVKSGDATIKIASTETVIGGVIFEYDKNIANSKNRIGFDVNVTVRSNFSNEYDIEINNDQDPKELFSRTLTLGTTPVTISMEYFFLAGVGFKGSADFTRIDHYHYKRIYDFNFRKTQSEDNLTSINDLEASIEANAHVGLRPMVSIGVVGIDIAGLYVDAKVKEAINISGKLSDTTSEICATSKLDFSLQGGYKLIGGEYKLLGEPYIKNLRTDTIAGCVPSYRYFFLPSKISCPARPYSTVSKKSYKSINKSSVSNTGVSDDGISSELSHQESYERVIQIDKTGIGDKVISKVTWETVDGDMDIKIESLKSDGSQILISATDEEGNHATLKATIHATDGTTISQEINIVRNSKPVAVPKVYISGNYLVLDASESYDPDGNEIIGYGWVFSDTGEKIINRSAINKVPLSNLPNVVNLRMAVASKNKPIELSEVESVSFDIPTTSDLSSLIVGKTLYQNCNGSVDTITFGTDGIITWIEDGHTETETYRIEGNTIYTSDGDGENVHPLLESTDTYVKFDDGDGETTTFYFSEEDAKNAPADECAGRGNIEVSNVTSGKVVFKDANNNMIDIPSDAWMRITPSQYQEHGNWNGLRCHINTDGTFGDICYIDEDGIREAFSNSNTTYQVVVFKNHIEPDELGWDCGEDLYKYVGNDLSSDSWTDIEVTSDNYQDRSDETCND